MSEHDLPATAHNKSIGRSKVSASEAWVRRKPPRSHRLNEMMIWLHGIEERRNWRKKPGQTVIGA